MAKVSMIQRDIKRKRKNLQYAKKRADLKQIIMSKTNSIEEKFEAATKLAKLPRNSAKNRQRNRCEVTGRPRGFYRKFKMSRISLRELASLGMIPGVKKSSW